MRANSFHVLRPLSDVSSVPSLSLLVPLGLLVLYCFQCCCSCEFLCCCRQHHQGHRDCHAPDASRVSESQAVCLEPESQARHCCCLISCGSWLYFDLVARNACAPPLLLLPSPCGAALPQPGEEASSSRAYPAEALKPGARVVAPFCCFHRAPLGCRVIGTIPAIPSVPPTICIPVHPPQMYRCADLSGILVC